MLQTQKRPAAAMQGDDQPKSNTNSVPTSSARVSVTATNGGGRPWLDPELMDRSFAVMVADLERDARGLQRLVDLGVDDRAWHCAGGLGLARVSLAHDRLLAWPSALAPTTALAVPVWAGRPPHLGGTGADLLDLVFCRPWQDPGRLWCWAGEAECLGLWLLEEAATTGGAVRIAPNLLAWLREPEGRVLPLWPSWSVGRAAA